MSVKSLCAECAKHTYVPAQIQKIIDDRLVCKDQRVDEWYKARTTLMTASDIPKILGESFFGSSHTIIRSKLKAVAARLNLPIQETPYGVKKCDYVVLPEFSQASIDAMEWGTNQEPNALEEFIKRTGHKVVGTGLLRHPTFSFLGGSPDGITYCGAIVEIKCPYSAKIAINPRVVPAQYRSQVQSLLEITGLDRAYFVQFRPAGYAEKGRICLSEECKFSCLEVPRNIDWSKRSIPLIEICYNDFCRELAVRENCLLEYSPNPSI